MGKDIIAPFIVVFTKQKKNTKPKRVLSIKKKIFIGRYCTGIRKLVYTGNTLVSKTGNAPV